MNSASGPLPPSDRPPAKAPRSPWQASADGDFSGVGMPRNVILRGLFLRSWLYSVGLHMGVFSTLGFAVNAMPRGMPQAEPDRKAGIVLVHEQAEKIEYFSEKSSAPSSNSAQSSALPETSNGSSNGKDRPSPLPSATDVPVELAKLLPLTGGTEGIAGEVSLPAAENFTSGAGVGADRGAAASGAAGTGGTTTSVFGTTGRGHKFVYVFDRSGSMEGYQGRPLAAAKRELLVSLSYLKSVHQFQIIFYNEIPSPFNPNPAAPPKLHFADSRGQKDAAAYIAQVQASGGTRHYESILMALNLAPDVVFFLTDGDEPGLTSEQMASLRLRNDRIGAAINTIEFGFGPARGGRNFLKQLAEENRGSYAYVDIAKFPAPGTKPGS